MSLRLEVSDNERKIRELHDQIASLQKESSFWQSQLNTHRQAWNAFLKLDAIGFGLNELQQLKDTVSEIAVANSIPEDQAVHRFVKDVENHYNIKLGFEGKVNEKRRELEQLNSKIKYKEAMLELDPLTAKTLHSLLQNGVGEQDIMDYGHLSQEYKDNNSSSSGSTSFDSAPNDRDNKTGHGGKYNHKSEKGSDTGKSLTDDLKKHGGLKHAIKEQSERLDMIKQEIKDSDRQKQELLAYCYLAIALINIINYQIPYFKSIMDRYNQIINTKFKPTTSSAVLIFVIYDNKPGDKEKEGEGEEGDKQN